MGYVSRIPRFLWRVFRHEQRTFGVEVYLALQALVFGAWLLAPWDTFQQVPDIYSTLGLVPEWIWGCLFFGHGVLHLAALEMGSMRLRHRGTSVLVFLWMIVLISFLTTAPLSSATPMYAFPALAGLWASIAQTRGGRA